jgi:hypothetical protein
MEYTFDCADYFNGDYEDSFDPFCGKFLINLFFIMKIYAVDF